ncbi:molybdopterin converting factor subunit 1 [Motiliproteus sediminis]|uniref:molybdopterin converting factor subunit 1 n=1 Tax=Motiliproteus sediminis TaxID=1468178 RepID=UPI001AF0275C|nr:molybdopterin converting factor subunit 1 [Motiliproteus sediminis]
MIKVVYFASIREQLDCEQEQVEASAGMTVEALLQVLKSRGTPWDTVLGSSSLLIAVNQEMVAADQAVKDGDEVAFFPPVTGG